MIINDFDLVEIALQIKDYIILNKYVISLLILLILIIQCIIIFIIIAFIVFFCFIFCSFYVYKFFKLNTNNYCFFKDYNERVRNILNKYRDNEIKNVYILRQKLPLLIFKIINILSFYKYADMFMPVHTSLIFEIKTDKKQINKFLKVEKNNYININENYNINRTQDIKYIRFNRKNRECLTLNQILTKTRERVSKDKFFNWHIFSNNCQQFTKELLTTMEQYTKSNKQFVFQDTKIIVDKFSDFHYYLTNCTFNVYNLLQQIFITSSRV